MKVFLISNMYPSEKDPDYGIFVQNIENLLVENGVKITHKSVIRGRSKTNFQKLKRYIQLYFDIAKNYYKGDYDFIYIHFISHIAPIIYFLSIFSTKKRVIVINAHGSDILTHNKGIIKYFISRVLKFTNLIIVPSDIFREVVFGIFPFFEFNKIFVSPSGGIDPTTFFLIKEKNNNSTLKVCYVSRIEKEKGWEVFLKSLNHLKKQNIPFDAIIIGKGSQTQKMLNCISAFNLEKDVQYLGALLQPDLNNIFNESDLFVFPTFSESLGLVGLEAMACGTPIICSDLEVLHTYVKHGVNGYFFPINNDLALAELIKLFIELNIHAKAELSKNALETAKSFYSTSVSKELYIRFELLMKDGH